MAGIPRLCRRDLRRDISASVAMSSFSTAATCRPPGHSTRAASRSRDLRFRPTMKGCGGRRPRDRSRAGASTSRTRAIRSSPPGTPTTRAATRSGSRCSRSGRPAAGAIYAGDIYVDSGPPFNNFTGSAIATKVGTGTLTFSDSQLRTVRLQHRQRRRREQRSAARAHQSLHSRRQQPAARLRLRRRPRSRGRDQLSGSVVGAGRIGLGDRFRAPGQPAVRHLVHLRRGEPERRQPAAVALGADAREGTSNVFTGPLNRTSGPRFDNYYAVGHRSRSARHRR